ncbi:MAG TPA: signal peptidase I [Candidatus Dormibacteraeota bacterium]|nr:signal peptidase I [Candidatus Dormibacteraeota bacterium]
MFLLAILIAFLLTAFIFQQYQVDGPSMQTSLYNQNRLIVVKYQRTWARITGHPYVPKRGDIIIFNQGGLYNINGLPEKILVKRVVGLPGDRVVVSNGILKIYNKQHPVGFDPDKTQSYGKVIGYTSGNIDITLSKNYIYVMGDNRSDSLDSRVFGPVNTSQIIGKLVLRIYPFNTVKLF